jgi:hypothetical protein
VSTRTFQTATVSQVTETRLITREGLVAFLVMLSSSRSFSQINFICLFHFIWEPVSLIGIAPGYGLDDRGFESRQGLGIFLFTTASRPTLGTTQSPIQWAPGALSLVVKRPVREADHSPPSSAEVKNAWNYTSTP